MKQTVGSVTTVYVNQYYEKNITSGEVTTSYYLGSKLIAVRKGATLSFVMQDHLGSTTGTVNTGGAITSANSYFSFGGVRFSSGTLPTDKQFTGQRLDSTGLYYYGARYYDPAIPIRGDEQGLSFLPINRDGIRKMRRRIGRFISPDTVVQNPANPQTLNRYSYCLNNPLKFIDPSGHEVYVNGNNVSEYYNFVEMMGMGIYTTPTTAVINLAADSLFAAYDAYRNAAIDYAQSMENAKQILNIIWGKFDGVFQDEGCINISKTINGDPVEFTITINERFKCSIGGAAMVIGHESIHALREIFFPGAPNSKYEEATAIEFQGKIGKQIGYSPSWNLLSLDGAGNRLNPFLVSFINLDIDYGNKGFETQFDWALLGAYPELDPFGFNEVFSWLKTIN